MKNYRSSNTKTILVLINMLLILVFLSACDDGGKTMSVDLENMFDVTIDDEIDANLNLEKGWTNGDNLFLTEITQKEDGYVERETKEISITKEHVRSSKYPQTLTLNKGEIKKAYIFSFEEDAVSSNYLHDEHYQIDDDFLKFDGNLVYYSIKEDEKVTAIAKKEKEIEEQKEKERKQEADKKKAKLYEKIVSSLNNLSSESDTMSDTVWFYNSYLENYADRKQIYPYISMIIEQDNLDVEYVEENISSLFPTIYIRYSTVNDSWLFAKGPIEIKTDNEKYNLNTSFSDWDGDNSAYETWEWYSRSMSSSDYEMYKDIINSETSIIRINGDVYYDEREISTSEKNALDEILSVYELFLEYEEIEY